MHEMLNVGSKGVLWDLFGLTRSTKLKSVMLAEQKTEPNHNSLVSILWDNDSHNRFRCLVINHFDGQAFSKGWPVGTVVEVMFIALVLVRDSPTLNSDVDRLGDCGC